MEINENENLMQTEKLFSDQWFATIDIDQIQSWADEYEVSMKYRAYL